MSGDEQERDMKSPRSDSDDQKVAELIRAAVTPDALSEPDHEALIALALGDEAANISDQERAEAEALRRGLEGEHHHPLVALAEALRAARCEGQLDDLRHEKILRRAEQLARRPRPWGAVLGGIVAAAAALALMIGPWGSAVEHPGAPRAATGVEVDRAWVKSRSSTALFDPASAFPSKGGESRRVDMVARARAADLRANRFTSWGVR